MYNQGITPNVLDIILSIRSDIPASINKKLIENIDTNLPSPTLTNNSVQIVAELLTKEYDVERLSLWHQKILTTELSIDISELIDYFPHPNKGQVKSAIDTLEF